MCRSSPVHSAGRRGWLVFSQLLLIGATSFAAGADPTRRRSPLFVALGALLGRGRCHRRRISWVDCVSASRACPRVSRPPGMASYVGKPIGSACWSRPRARAVHGQRVRSHRSGAAPLGHGCGAYVAMAALVLIGHRHWRSPATEPGQSAGGPRRPRTSTEFRVSTRVICMPRSAAFSEFLVRKDALAALAFVGAVQIHRCVFPVP